MCGYHHPEEGRTKEQPKAALLFFPNNLASFSFVDGETYRRCTGLKLLSPE